MENMRGVILYTDDGVKFFGNFTNLNGFIWDKNNCFKYCNDPEAGKTRPPSHSQACKLKALATLLNPNIKRDKDWYKDINNFVSAELSVIGEYVTQCTTTCSGGCGDVCSYDCNSGCKE